MLARPWYVPVLNLIPVRKLCNVRFGNCSFDGHAMQENKFYMLQGSGLFAAGAFAAAELLDTKDTERILDTASDEFK